MNKYTRMIDRIERAEEIQQYTENRCKTLEEENRLLGERCNQLLKDKGDLTDKIEQAIKILRNIAYMSNTGLSSKNELAFARLIGEAERFLQNIYTKNKSSDERKEPQGDWVVQTKEPL